jgi:hypothetical protein
LEAEAATTPPKKKRPEPSRDSSEVKQRINTAKKYQKSPRKLPFGQTPESPQKKKDSPRKKKKTAPVSEVDSEQWISARRKGTSDETR